MISVALGVSITYTNPVLAVGKIVVNNDEWTLSNTGFSNAPDTATFVNNITSWFTGGVTGNFHAYSTNFGFTGSSLANTMANAGNTWTTGTNITFDVATLLNYDGIFVGENSADNQVLIDYVKAGGNVYLAGGTGVGGAVNEANLWNTFLNAFGLKFEPTYNFVGGNISINSPHPIFKNVTQLYQYKGNSVTDLFPSNPTQQVLVNSSAGGLYAVYSVPEPSTSVPEPSTILGSSIALGFGAFFKRKLAQARESNKAD